MYVKLFGSVFDGTLRGRSKTLLVWINILTRADKDGFYDRHFKAICDETGYSLEEVKEAIRELESPDPDSRSPELEGRRLERVDAHRDWSWRVVNYAKYRDMKNDDERREYNKIAQRRYRQAQQRDTRTGELGNKSSVTDHYTTVTPPEVVILHLLNSESGASFRDVAIHLDLIRDRLNETGVTVDGVEAMVKRQCKLWATGTTSDGKPMKEFLTPSTLFRKSNFAKYYDQRDMPVTEAAKPQQSFAFQAPKITKLAPHAPIEDGAGIAAALDGKS